MKPLRELTAAELSALTDDELVDGFVADIDAFHQGSRNRRAEHLRFARSEEMAGVIKALWDEAEAKRPPPTPKPPEVTLAPQIDAGPSVSGKPSWVRLGGARALTQLATAKVVATDNVEVARPTLKGVVEDLKEVQVLPAQGKALAVPIGFAPMSAGELVLNPATPFDSAQKLVSLRAWQPDEGVRTWMHWQGSFWQWTGQRWKEVEDETVRAFLWFQLNDADKIARGGRRERFEPKPEHVNALTDALKAATNCPTKGHPMPGWFGKARDDKYVRECVALQNGILHIPTRQTNTHTPRYWSPNVLDFILRPIRSRS